LAQDVAAKLGPAGPEGRRQVRQRHLDRLLVGQILVGMDDLLSRAGRVAERAVERIVAALDPEPERKERALVIRKQHLVVNDQRRSIQTSRLARGLEQEQLVWAEILAGVAQ